MIDPFKSAYKSSASRDLCFLAKDHEKRQLDIDPEMWMPEELRGILACKEADHNFERIDIDIVDPGKCQTDFGWDAW